MAKHKTREEWIELFKEYEETHEIPVRYFESIAMSNKISYAKRRPTINQKMKHARFRFKEKYKLWKILDNKFMSKKENRGRKPKRDIDGFVRNLTREQLEEIAKVHIKQNENKKDKSAKYSHFSKKDMAFILNIHRTTMYKSKVKRIYKFDIYKNEIISTFNEAKGIYGRRKVMIILSRKGITMNNRTLGRYLNRYGLITKTRVARRKTESKRTNVKFNGLVRRDFNPNIDNIIATDVSYIPANEQQNNVYLSVAISHKTKAIESFKVSKTNDILLVVDTIKNLKRNKFILHSDHGFQYSSKEILKLNKSKEIITSMSRIGNSLDNREAGNVLKSANRS